MDKVTWKVETSRGTFATYSEKPDYQIFELTQVHGTGVVDLRGELPSSSPEADGAIASYNSPLLPAIKTADCLPILLLGKDSYALLHAGWRGIASPIMGNPLLQDLDIEEIYLGPSISVKGFEVSADFKDNFPGSPNFAHIGEQIHFNLWEEARLQALKYFPRARFNQSGECTWTDERYHSYRRDKTSQRNWNLFLPANLGKINSNILPK